MTNVLLFTTSLSTIGPARALVAIASRLDRSRFRVVVCHFDRAEESMGRLRDELAAQDVPVYALGGRGMFDLRALARLCGVLRRERIHVLHTRLIRADFYGRLAGRFVGVPVIITNLCDIYSQHFESWHDAWRGRLLSRLDRLTLGFADAIVVNAEGISRDMLATGMARDRIVRIYNGIDAQLYAPNRAIREEARRELGFPDEAWVVGTVARLSPKKGLRWLIEAVPELVRREPRTRVLIVGDGPERTELERQVTRLGIAERVRFLGHRADVPRLLASMDVFAFPSMFEGHPNAIIEAMATELPVVAFAVPGCDEVVIDRVTGRLVPPKDVHALAEALLEFRHPDVTRATGLAGRRLVTARFSLHEMSDRFSALYLLLLEGAGSGPMETTPLAH